MRSQCCLSADNAKGTLHRSQLCGSFQSLAVDEYSIVHLYRVIVYKVMSRSMDQCSILVIVCKCTGNSAGLLTSLLTRVLFLIMGFLSRLKNWEPDRDRWFVHSYV